MGYTYEPITTFFQPTEWSEDIKGQFGLLPGFNWDSFKRSITDLSAKSSNGECIKVIYLARHGHGEHNIIHEKYKSWEEVSEPTPISQLTRQTSTSIDKKAKMVHIPHDASLAPSGIIEALEVASALRRESDKGMPRPERFFVSSLKRTGETCGLEWGWLLDSSDEAGHSVGIGERGGWVEGGDRGCGIPATVIENFRESLSGGQHNSRSSLSLLKSLFPTFTFPEGMTEMDEMWVPETWEKEDEGLMCQRLEKGMGEVMKRSEGVTYISITSHKTATERLRLFLGMEERILGLCEMNILVLKVRERASDQGTPSL